MKESLFETVTSRTDLKPWTRNDFIKVKTAQQKREKMFDRFRAPILPCKRFAVVKREGKYFSIVGVGVVRVKTFAGLTKRAKDLGFTDVKFGAIKTSIV